jgi:hypothetical protein
MAAYRALAVASLLFPPDVRISRIRRSLRLSMKGIHGWASG